MATKFNALTGNFDLVNDLGDNLTDIAGITGNKGDILVYDGTNWVDLAVGSNNQVLTADSAQTKGIKWGDSSGGFQAEINIAFRNMSVNTTTNYAPLVYVDLGTVEDMMAAFDGDQDEYRQGVFSCPSDIDTSGTVTFEIYGKRASGTGAANVVFDFDHRAVADSEAGDGSYTTEGSGALAVDTTSGDLDRLTWSETVSNLGWSADDLIIFRVGRQGADASDTLNSVDYYAWNFRLLIPRA